MSIPENVTEAAELAYNANTVLEGEMLISDTNLGDFDAMTEQVKTSARAVNEILLSQAEDIIQSSQASNLALVDAKEDILGIKEYYDSLLGDLQKHGLDMDIVLDVKDRAEKLAAATENLEADLNQAINRETVMKENITTARLRFEEAVQAAVEETKSLYDEYAKNSAVVYRDMTELAQITEAIALR